MQQILAAAGTVPDHGSLRPYRFVVIEGEARTRFGDALAKSYVETSSLPDFALEKVRAKMHGKAFRSPSIIALIASPKPGKVPAWEQTATAACAGYAIVLAAHALGIGAVWKSVPFTRGQGLTEALSLTPEEEMLGWIHLGTPRAGAVESPREPFDVASVTTMLR